VSIPTVNVTVQVNDSSGSPVEGAHIVAKLTTTEKHDGFVVPANANAETDATGMAVLALWPNELGTEGSEYRIRIINPVTGKSDVLYVTVPNQDCNLADIADLDPYAKASYSVLLDAKVDQNTANIATNAADIAGEAVARGLGDGANESAINAHTGRNDNPHGVTKDQVGLGNVLNVEQIPASEKAAANGVAPLGSDSKVPAGNLPSLNFVPTAEKGQPNGVATLGAGGQVPVGQIPPLDYVPATEKGAANGVATLGSDGTVPLAQINDKALLAATAREIGGTAYSNLLGIVSPPSLEFKAWNYKDETNGAPSISTFTRASTATYVDATGTIKTAAAGELRHNYNPITGEYKGWLIEESRTNLLTYSEDFSNAAWTKTGSSITSNATTAPDGETTADKLVEASGGTYHQLIHSSAVGSGANTFSFFVQSSGDSRSVNASIYNPTDGTVAVIRFNPDTGLVEDGTAYVDEYRDGWYRVWFSGTTTVANSSVYLTLYNGSALYSGDGSSGLYIWGAQLEVGASPSSYIPTTTAAATRAADVLSVSTSDFAYNQNEGTLYVEFSLDALGPSGNVIAEFWEDASNRWLFFVTATGVIQIMCRTDGVIIAQMTLGGVVVGTTHRAAFSIKQNEFKGCLDGGTVYTDTSGALPDSITRLDIGNYGNVSAFLNGKLPHLCYFSRAAGDAVQLLTS
jgi:hypothetical protein